MRSAVVNTLVLRAKNLAYLRYFASHYISLPPERSPGLPFKIILHIYVSPERSSGATVQNNSPHIRFPGTVSGATVKFRAFVFPRNGLSTPLKHRPGLSFNFSIEKIQVTDYIKTT